MDINALRTALKAFEDPSQQLFAMPAAQITGPEWTAVRDLVTGSTADQTLTITGITRFPPEQVTDAVVYAGQATLFPWSPPMGGTPSVQAALSVTARFTVKDKPPLDMLRKWIEESYRAVAPKNLVAKLDEPPSRRAPRRIRYRKRRP